MRNNGKKQVRLLAAALLALAMTLSLTACQVEIPGVGTININDGNTPTGGNAPTGGNTPDGGGTDGDGMDGGEPGAYDDSLDLLRQDMPFFSLKLRYQGETLVYACLNGKELTL